MTDRLKVHALDPAGATDGQVPKYDAAAGRVVWATGGGGATTLDALTDVDTTTTPPASGQVLKFNGTVWAPAADSTGTGGGGSGYPPGSADVPPAVANAKDDEFDGTSTATWIATPTAPNVANVNSTVPHGLYMKATGSGSTLVGRYQAAPSFPFTITTKLTGTTARQNFMRGGGIILLPSAPTNASAATYFGPVYNSTGIEFVRIAYTNMSTFGSQSTLVGPRWGVPAPQMYLRAVVTSATAVSFYASHDGRIWTPLNAGYTNPFSIANIGLGLSEEATGGCEARLEFFRVS